MDSLKKEQEILRLHGLVVGMYWFTVPNERKEYLGIWEPMQTRMVQYAHMMNNAVAQKLYDLIKQDPRLPVGTKFDPMPEIHAAKSVIYITLPGKSWVEENETKTREIYISVTKRCTINRFSIVPCIVDKKGTRIAKTFQSSVLPKTEDDDIDETFIEPEKIKLLAKTFDDVMETLVLLASFESFADLNNHMLEKEKTYQQQIQQ